MRDDFSEPIKRRIAARAGYRCSRPECGASTTEPQLDSHGTLNLGVAAHIHAASDGGPRYVPEMSAEKRGRAANGIWLCQTCGKLVAIAHADDAATVLQECLSRRVNRVMLYSENLPDRFFDLSSGEAGVILQKFRNYNIRLAVVCSSSVRLSRRFGEMVAEERRGRTLDSSRHEIEHASGCVVIDDRKIHHHRG